MPWLSITRELQAAQAEALSEALEVATGNALVNGVTLRAMAPELLPAGTHDVVLANILAGPLIALEPLFAVRTRRGGRGVFSGILASQAAEVAAAYAGDFDAAVGPNGEGWALIEGQRR